MKQVHKKAQIKCLTEFVLKFRVPDSLTPVLLAYFEEISQLYIQEPMIKKIINCTKSRMLQNTLIIFR